MASPFTTPFDQLDAIHDAERAPGTVPAHLVKATDRAISYLRDLMLEKARATGADMVRATVEIDMWIENHSGKGDVSANIDRLKAEGYTGTRTVVGTPDGYTAAPEVVPAGRYAIDTSVHAVNGTAFYKVDRPTEGKWAGRVFVKQIVGDDEQRLSQKQGLAIIAKIAEAGAEAASARYGHEIGECGICGRTLTNDESRERGIGPVCAAKAGW